MRRLWIGVAVAVGLGAILTASLVGRRPEGETAYVETVERRAIRHIVKASGKIDPLVKVEISPEVVGKVERLPVEEGDPIAAGELFVQLQRTTFEAARDRAAAALAMARSDLRQTELALANAELRLRRTERLADQKIVSATDLEQMQLEHQTAELRVEQARESVLQARATLQQAQEDLAKTTIYAPLTGRVVELNVETGEAVIPGTPNLPGAKLGTIADLSEILAEVDVDETEIVHVALDQEATVLVDALPDREYGGRVVEIGSSGFQRSDQPDVTYFKVKILLDEPDRSLRPGMSARAEILAAEHQEVLVLPIQAVVERPPLDAEGEPQEDANEIEVVFRLVDGEAVQTPVETGLSDTTDVEILAGVEEGQEIVVGPYRTLRDLRHGDPLERSGPKLGDGGEDDEEE